MREQIRVAVETIIRDQDDNLIGVVTIEPLTVRPPEFPEGLS